MLAEKIKFQYMRLSKEDGDVAEGISEESQSISSQRECIHQYCKANFGNNVCFEEIIDDGHSGTHFNRPGIKRLLQLVEAEKVDTIVVRDLSRFARNYLEAGHYLEYVFPAYEVRFISINDGYDSAEFGETTAGLHIAIKNLINQLYSKDISRKIKSAVDLKKMSGEFVYGTAPYGYKKGAARNTIVIDEQAATVVRRIFDNAANGLSVTQIAKNLNSDHITTPSVYLSDVRGKYKTRSFWTYESVRNILSNRIYTGDTVPFKSHVVRIGSDRVKQLPEEEQIILPDTHEAIITREEFFQARTTIRSNVKSAPRNKPSPLASFLVCSCCGNRLAKGKPSNKTFLCSSARYMPDSDCSLIRCDEQNTKDVVLRAIQQQCRIMDTQIRIIKRANQKSRTESASITDDLKLRRKQLDAAEAGKMQLYEEYISGNISKDIYLKKKSVYSEQEQSFVFQIAVLEEKLAAQKAKSIDQTPVINGQEIVEKLLKIRELTADLLSEIIKKIVVFPDGSINIVWNFKDIVEEAKVTSV